MQDLFIELFPINIQAVPNLTAYRMTFEQPPPATTGQDLAARFDYNFSGNWVWSQGILLTNEPITNADMDGAVEYLKRDVPDLYHGLASIVADSQWQPVAQNVIDFVLQTRILPIQDELQTALGKMTVAIENAKVERDYRLRTWVINNLPALSLTIESHLLYAQNLQQYTESLKDKKEIAGLSVVDRRGGITGTVKSITGKVKKRRKALFEGFQSAPDTDLTIEVATSTYSYEYPASMLQITVQPDNHDELQRFGISAGHAQRALNLRPDTRSQLVKILSDRLKANNIIDNAYNTRTTPELFLQATFAPGVEFAKNKTRDYDFNTLTIEFQKNGIHARHPRFDNSPIKIAIVNTLDEPIDDFVEALRRDLERNYDFRIEMLRERKVRVISNKNLESAIRVVEKEEPHIVLLFLPDTTRDNLDAIDPNFQQVKSLTLGKGIASHAIYRKTVHNPDAMPRVAMGIIGKTGNLPYILAEPLDYADMVVGMDMVRQVLTQFDRVTAMARVYDNAGRGYGYIMDTVELDSGDPIPFVVMQTLFPEAQFKNKRVIIHRLGAFSGEELSMLERWGQVIGATFYPVAIETELVPHIYSLAKKSIGTPDWGTMFVLNGEEALIVTTTTDNETMPMPLFVSAPPALGIEYGLHSVLMWTLLHYGTLRPSRLPVTIQYAREMQEWMARGQLPSATAGDVPFWL